jgi:CheY-like chemotaxis protein
MPEQPHVLVVDDDSHIAASLRRALIYEGYAVDVAPDGVMALNRARERMPDLVVLDVMLPGMSGVEVCQRLRAAGDVPILMLTARDGTADRVVGLDSGADDYLVKHRSRRRRHRRLGRLQYWPPGWSGRASAEQHPPAAGKKRGFRRVGDDVRHHPCDQHPER